MVSRVGEGCRYNLRNNRFTVHPLNGAAEHRVLATTRELRLVLTRELQLTLPDHPDIENVLHCFTESGSSELAEV